MTPKSSNLLRIRWRKNCYLWHPDIGKKICDTINRPKYRICDTIIKKIVAPSLTYTRSITCPGFWTQKSWVLSGICDTFHVTNLLWQYVIYEQPLIYIQILCLISTTIMSYSWKDSFLWCAVLTWLFRDSPLEGDHCKLLQQGTLHLPMLMLNKHFFSQQSHFVW